MVDLLLEVERCFDVRPEDDVVSLGLGTSFAFLGLPGTVLVLCCQSSFGLGVRGGSFSYSGLLEITVHLKTLVLGDRFGVYH